MSGFGAFIASSGLRWNRRCAFHPRTRSAIRCRVCQSLSFHQSSRMSAAGIVAYPQCRSLVGDFVQCTHISASSGSSSIPSGGHIASFTSSPSFDMRGINVRSPILHCFPLSFSHSYARLHVRDAGKLPPLQAIDHGGHTCVSSFRSSRWC